MTAKSPAKGTTKKHAAPSSAAKHAAHVKHEAHLAHLAHLKAIGKAPKVTVKATPAKPAKAAKARSFAVGDLLPVCAFEAVAMSLRLAGNYLSDDDVAGLWELAGSPEEGVGIGEALAVASRVDLGVGLGHHDLVQIDPAERRRRLARRQLLAEPCHGGLEVGVEVLGNLIDPGLFHGLILGIDVPGPHAVLATADGWWSWGELHDPWPCRIEEAWAVSWS